MAYQPNIPQATDQLSQSQADILANFQAIQTLIDVNHVDFASGDQGKHKWITFPVQSGAPAFAAGEVGAYNLLSAVTSVDELYLNKQNAGGAVQVPITSSILSTNAAPTAATTTWSYLPSGLILITGRGNGTGLVTINWASATIPTLTAVVNAMVCPYNAVSGSDSNLAVALNSIASVSSITVYVSPRTSTGAGTGSFQWWVLGY